MSEKVPNIVRWKKKEAGHFWSQIAEDSHLVQIYENDELVLDALEGFAVSGFRTDEAVVIIATADHIKSLNRRLILHGFDLNVLQRNNQYITLNADDTLEKFMVVGLPDEDLFYGVVTDLIAVARGTEKRRVRAYGEMVAILWSKGQKEATMMLEQLWNKFCSEESLCLFCAYSKSDFDKGAKESIKHICSTHNMLISGSRSNREEVYYRKQLNG
jgi:hypothetical protein